MKKWAPDVPSSRTWPPWRDWGLAIGLEILLAAGHRGRRYGDIKRTRAEIRTALLAPLAKPPVSEGRWFETD